MNKVKISLAAIAMCLLASNVFSQKISDNELKSNPAPIKDAVERITQLEPISFNYNSQKFNKLSLPAGQQYGFSTNNVEAIFPTLVKHQTKLVAAGKNSYQPATIKNVDMVSLIPFLVGAIKEHQEEIEKLKTEIHSLKSTANTAK